MGGIGNKAQLRPAGAGAWPELGKNVRPGQFIFFCFESRPLIPECFVWTQLYQFWIETVLQKLSFSQLFKYQTFLSPPLVAIVRDAETDAHLMQSWAFNKTDNVWSILNSSTYTVLYLFICQYNSLTYDLVSKHSICWSKLHLNSNCFLVVPKSYVSISWSLVRTLKQTCTNLHLTKTEITYNFSHSLFKPLLVNQQTIEPLHLS